MKNFVILQKKMFKLKKCSLPNPCHNCPVETFCSKMVNNDGEVLPEIVEILKDPQYKGGTGIFEEGLNIACKCKRDYPNFTVVKESVLNRKQTRHVVVGRGGNIIASSNSFWGMIVQMFIISIVAILILSLIGLILSGIGSLFK